MAGYSSRSLVEKLGIKPGTSVILMDGPPEYAGLLGKLPAGAAISTTLPPVARFIHQFARCPRAARALEDGGMLWVSWPKKASKLPTDLTEDVVRSVGLPLGLVDVKVCAVDDVWSGLKFVWRK